MTYEQYWYGDPLMARAFYLADKEKTERRDEQAWLVGSYVYKALDATVGNIFRKKGSQPAKYPEKPSLREQREKKEEAQKRKTEEQEEMEQTFARAYMQNMMHMGKNWGKATP